MTLRLPITNCSIKVSILQTGVLLFLCSCSLKDKTPAPDPSTYISFINASKALDSTYIIINNVIMNRQPFLYKQGLGYFSAAPGNNSIGIVTKDSALVKKEVLLLKDQFYSAFATTNDDSTVLLVYVDSFKISEAGKAQLRFANLTSNAPVVNVSMDGGEVLAKKIAYRQISPFMNVPAGTFTVNVNDTSGTQAFYFHSIKVEAGKAYTLWTSGVWNSSGDTTQFSIHLEP